MMDEVVDATRRQREGERLRQSSNSDAASKNEAARNTPFIDYLAHRHASSEFARAEALHVQLIRMTYCLATIRSKGPTKRRARRI